MTMTRKQIWIAVAEGLIVISILLSILKLCKIIKISWTWALSPVWVPLAILTLMGLIISIILISIKRTRILDD